MAPVLEARGLEKIYGSGTTAVRALAAVDFTLEAGEILVLLGPSGSGKSTLLNLIAGLDRPTRGSLRIDGRELADFAESELDRWRNRRVGFIFQF